MTALIENGFDLFWRNPHNYVNEMKQNHEVNVAWDRGILTKLRIDQYMYSKMKFGPLGKFWRSYNISSWDCIEYDADCEPGKPRAVYPAFDWCNEDLDTLLGYIAAPWGEDASLYRDTSIPRHLRPVKGQPHRIFITNLPSMRTLEGKYQLVVLAKIQRKFPQAELFIHRLYGFGDLFGNKFRAGDIDPRMIASKGKIYLTNGRYFDTRTADRDMLSNYVRPLGWSVDELDDAKNRCRYNMHAAKWASLHWDKEGRPPMHVPKDFRPDHESSDLDLNPLMVKKDHPVSSSLSLETG
ncbi:gp001 [Rhodococcus phage ReqiDocB7]|uniref:terminase small subunit n=1 Tax=Rhodococcus phage ReqiDocB7 TaxID=691966 RepID=UPI0001CDEA8A|nr:terminase small subunit [Rhodococcus phage ReqiDocB7]ADD80787.1 gp001 [Rhodococcus phage ReqiDocB7]